MKVKTHSTRAHSPQLHNRESIPGVVMPLYLEGRQDSFTKKGRGAETGDRQQRQAWPEFQLKSAYAHHLHIPQSVQPSDHQTAHTILARLLELEEQGGWTQNEWSRLYRMIDAWRDRATGRDPKFNLQGWKRQGDGYHTPKLIKTLQQIRSAING